jgi:hypothetical protein
MISSSSAEKNRLATTRIVPVEVLPIVIHLSSK